MAIFEISVIVIALTFLLILWKIDKHVLQKFALAFVGVLLFEYFTQALWLNNNLEPWAYLYLDVSWIITLGWATIITVSRALVDLYVPKLKELHRFILYLVVVSIIGVVAENVVLGLGIRAYSGAVLEVMTGMKILLAPIETLYYIPVFMALVISFSRYWEINLKKTAKVKRKKR